MSIQPHLQEHRMFEYTLKKKFGVKHTYIKIDKKGNITVSGGLLLTRKYAEKLILSKQHWIQKKLTELESQKSKTLNSNEFYYLGEKYPIKYEIDEGYKGKVKYQFLDNYLLISNSYSPSNEEVIFARDEFYREKAKQILPNIVSKFSIEMKLYPNRITFRKAKTRWGSCSSNNNLSLSVYLLALPLELIEHVIVHELAHIKEKNHSQKFWNIVKMYRADFLEEKNKLKWFAKII